LLVIADTHIRNGDTGGVLPVIKRAAALARKHDATLVVGGDVFDQSRPRPTTLASAGKAFSVPSILLAGNHDRDSDAPGDNALAPLALIDRITVIDQPAQSHGAVFIPPAPRGTKGSEFFARALAQEGGGVKVAIAHFGIAAPDSPPQWVTTGALPLADAFTTMREHGVKLLLSGDWHGRKVYKQDDMTVIQIGALVPANRGESGDRFGYAYLVDTDTAEFRTFQLPGPRYYNTTDPGEAERLSLLEGARVTLTAPKGTICPDGVTFEVLSVKRDRKEVRESIELAEEEAIEIVVKETIREDLREEVADAVRGFLSRFGSSV
jgi:DNA repair exonuclease SbcCD nuclease subunit